MEKFENVESKEGYSSKIELHFFRHDEKEVDKSKKEDDLLLSEAGKKHAFEQSDNEDSSQSLAFGSSKKRTQETAGLIMAGGVGDIDGTESLEQLKEKLDEGINYGSKIAVDMRLDFIIDDGAYGTELIEASKKGELMKFLVEKSDERARELGDNKSLTYSREAAAIASIIKKYIEISPRWDKLVQDAQNDYTKELKRFLGTHQSIQESFLAKLIETTKGKGERDRFVSVLQNKGFGYAEGFECDVTMSEGSVQPKVHISYKKEGKTPEESFEFNEDVDIKIIEAIRLNEFLETA